MARASTFGLFLIVLVVAFGGMHFFLWARLARDTGLSEGWRRAAGLVLGLCALSAPAGMILGRHLPFRVGRFLLTGVYAWMGLALVLFTALFATDLARWGGTIAQWISTLFTGRAMPSDPSRRLFMARALASGAVLTTGGLSLLGIRGAKGAPRINAISVRIPRLPAALSGFTLAQISDLHVGPTIGEREVQRVVEMTNALRPDAIVITGDLVDGHVSDLRATTQHLARLRAPHGVFFVTGNHEYYSGARPWITELARYGIRTLENARIAIGDLSPGGASFDLAGVDDWSVSRARGGHWPALDQALGARDPDRALILLAHQPRGFEEAARAGVGLQLSGHTHGGQIFPWNLLVSAVYPYWKGLYTHRAHGREMAIYVSCGTGYWGPPMRLGAPAEITQIVLKA